MYIDSLQWFKGENTYLENAIWLSNRGQEEIATLLGDDIRIQLLIPCRKISDSPLSFEDQRYRFDILDRDFVKTLGYLEFNVRDSDYYHAIMKPNRQYNKNNLLILINNIVDEAINTHVKLYDIYRKINNIETHPT